MIFVDSIEPHCSRRRRLCSSTFLSDCDFKLTRLKK
jgi:hypothetical protein